MPRVQVALGQYSMSHPGIGILEKRLVRPAVPDSGSSTTVLPLEGVATMGLEMEEDEKLTAADASGRPLDVRGTVTLELSYPIGAQGNAAAENRTVSVKAMVVALPRSEMLIGRGDMIRLGMLPEYFLDTTSMLALGAVVDAQYLDDMSHTEKEIEVHCLIARVNAVADGQSQRE